MTGVTPSQTVKIDDCWFPIPSVKRFLMDGVQSLVNAQDTKLCSLIDKLASLLLELALDLL